MMSKSGAESHVVGVGIHFAELEVAPIDEVIETVVVELEHAELGVLEDGKAENDRYV